MASRNYIALMLASIATSVSAKNSTVDLGWYPPKKSWINDLDQVLNGTGTNGFVFNSSQLPAGVEYGTYNWCNMPHVRKDEYVKVGDEFELVYVEVIHRHHKRTPYASNTFPKESYRWDCDDQGLFYYGEPLNPPSDNTSAPTYWSVYTSPVNPFAPSGFNGSCQFPQITRQGLDDSFQHGKDLFGVYHSFLGFLPAQFHPSQISYRVSNNVITSQVAGMLIRGMYASSASPTPLLVQPPTIDSLAPAYSCPSASSLYSSYAVGSTAPAWTAHLSAAQPLFAALDAISGVSSDAPDWHTWFDHYYDNLSARQCHAKPLPCNISDQSLCVTQAQADTVYRLGQYEYSFIYRDAPQSLAAAAASYGVYLAELASHIRRVLEGSGGEVRYRHNVAHDGSMARLLSFLQVEQMVWVGMGSEVVFEVYKAKNACRVATRDNSDNNKRGECADAKAYIRILWGGQVLRSSNPSLGWKQGSVDMLDVEVFLAYVDGLVGREADKVVGLCNS